MVEVMKVRVVSNYYGTSGVSSHTRGLCQGLLSQGVDVRVSSPRPPDFARWSTDQEIKMLTTESDRDEVMIMIGAPPYWRFGLAEKPKKFIGILVWEGDRIPKAWIPHLLDERVDNVWVPSIHVYNAILCTVINKNIGDVLESMPSLMEKVNIVPHGFDSSVYSNLRGTPSYEDKKPKRKFSFFANKGLGMNVFEDRGGLQYVIKAFYEEFKADEAVRLIVKVNGAYVNIPDKGSWLRGVLQQLGCVDRHAEMQLCADDMNAADLRGLYEGSDVFVCAARAEGFNIPGLEAKACGLATVQTGYGGQSDYMEDNVDWKIASTPTPVTWDIAYEGISWSTPDVAELRTIMRYCFEHQEEVAERGRKAAKGALGWSWQDTGEKAVKLLKEL